VVARRAGRQSGLSISRRLDRCRILAFAAGEPAERVAVL